MPSSSISANQRRAQTEGARGTVDIREIGSRCVAVGLWRAVEGVVPPPGNNHETRLPQDHLFIRSTGRLPQLGNALIRMKAPATGGRPQMVSLVPPTYRL